MLNICDLSAGYQGISVVKNINFQVDRGSITSIIGINGCGKSTLLRTICGLHKPYSGEIFLEEKPITTRNSNSLAVKISYLSQNLEYPNISIYEFVMYGRFPHMKFPRIPNKKDKEKVMEALQTLELYQEKDKMLNELSGGQRQKAYIAMILAQDTDIILLDEPTTYLDINHQLEIMDIIKHLKSIGKTVLMVLHDLNYAFSYSDKVLVLDKGELIAYDTPLNLLDNNIIPPIFNVICKSIQVTDHQNHFVFSLKK